MAQLDSLGQNDKADWLSQPIVYWARPLYSNPNPNKNTGPSGRPIGLSQNWHFQLSYVFLGPICSLEYFKSCSFILANSSVCLSQNRQIYLHMFFFYFIYYFIAINFINIYNQFYCHFSKNFFNIIFHNLSSSHIWKMFLWPLREKV